MHSAANNSLIFTNFSSLDVFAEAQPRSGMPAFYQQLGIQLTRELHSRHLLTDLGDKLVALAEHAYSFRQVEKLQALSQALIALPLPDQYRSAGRYFRAMELSRLGDREAARSILEGVAGERPHKYTARAIQSMGQTFQARGDFESALKLYVEAGSRAAERGRGDYLTALFAQKNIAVMKSVNGDHHGALNILEEMLSLTKVVSSVYPAVYYDYHNSLAVELDAMGRMEEASYASRIAVSTKLAYAYPEWRETFNEIAAKQQRPSRSTVPVRTNLEDMLKVEGSVGQTNLLRLPSTHNPTSTSLLDPARQGARARILNFQQWKTMVNASSRPALAEVTTEQRTRMTTGEKLIRLMDLISQDETDDETIDRILEAVEQIVSRPRNQQLD